MGFRRRAIILNSSEANLRVWGLGLKLEAEGPGEVGAEALDTRQGSGLGVQGLGLGSGLGFRGSGFGFGVQF